jgi:hypothetical protein
MCHVRKVQLQVAERFEARGTLATMRTTVCAWRTHTTRKQQQRLKVTRALARLDKLRLCLAFCCWAEVTSTCSTAKVLAWRSRHSLRHAWGAWRHAVVCANASQSAAFTAAKCFEQNRLLQVLRTWRDLVGHRRAKAARLKWATLRVQRARTTALLRGWLLCALHSKAAACQVSEAVAQRRSCLTRCWISWRLYQEKSREACQKAETLVARFQRQHCAAALRTWRAHVRSMHSARAQAESLAVRLGRQQMASVLSKWRTDVKDNRAVRSAAEVLAHRHRVRTLSKSWVRWRHYMAQYSIALVHLSRCMRLLVLCEPCKILHVMCTSSHPVVNCSCASKIALTRT